MIGGTKAGCKQYTSKVKMSGAGTSKKPPYDDGESLAYVIEITDYFETGDPDLPQVEPLNRDRLTLALSRLHYRSIWVNSPSSKFTSQDFEEFLKRVTLALFPEHIGSIMVVITGHGDAHTLYCSDGVRVSYDAVHHAFGTNRTLAGKPKLYLHAACYGHADTFSSIDEQPSLPQRKTIATTGADSEFRPTGMGHNLADHLEVHESPFGYSAYGQSLLPRFCETVEAFAAAKQGPMSIHTFLREVKHGVAELCTGLKKLPSYTVQMVKRFLLRFDGDSASSASSQPLDPLQLNTPLDIMLKSREDASAAFLNRGSVNLSVEERRERDLITAMVENFEAVARAFTVFYEKHRTDQTQTQGPSGASATTTAGGKGKAATKRTVERSDLAAPGTVSAKRSKK